MVFFVLSLMANARSMAQGAACVHALVVEPVVDAYSTSDSERHTPAFVSQIWLAHSVSPLQPRHVLEVASHTGEVAGQCSGFEHSTHTSSGPQCGVGAKH